MNTHICKRLEDYFDDFLSAKERFAFEQHLESCEDCRSELSNLAEVDELICVAWSDVGIPAELEPKVILDHKSTATATGKRKRAVAWTSLTALAGAILLTLWLTYRPTAIPENSAVATNEPTNPIDLVTPVAFYESGDNTTMLAPVVSTADFTIVNAFPVSKSINVKPESIQ